MDPGFMGNAGMEIQSKSDEKPIRYFVAVVCPPPLQDKINRLKSRVKEEYHCRVPMNSPPHLTLIPPFWIEPRNEPLVFHALDVFQYPPGIPQIRLQNFSHFDGRVLYIRVVEDPSLLDLKTKLESHFISILGGAVVPDVRVYHPHITLAQAGRRRSAFHRALEYFATGEFEDQFHADKISLLRHDGVAWQVIAEKKIE